MSKQLFFIFINHILFLTKIIAKYYKCVALSFKKYNNIYMNELTKKQIIVKLKMKKITPYLLKQNIKRRQLKGVLKDKLLLLLCLQEILLKDESSFSNLPYDIQFHIIKYI
jgi:hypothetical protein